MKTAKITKLELVNGDMHSVTLEWNPAEAKHVEDFDLSQLGGVLLNSGTERPGAGYVNITETDLLVGDGITDDKTGPVFAEQHGATTVTELKPKEGDYRDVWCEKHGLRP